MSRSHITLKQLQEIAFEHISYEIEMFEYTGKRLANVSLSQGDKNALLESFLLHARCLYDFLYPSKKTTCSDDVLADDFFDDIRILRIALPSELTVSSYLNFRAGKEIAHLTYGRLNKSLMQKQWKVDEVYNQIAEALVIFFEVLSDEKRSWFRKVMIRHL